MRFVFCFFVWPASVVIMDKYLIAAIKMTQLKELSSSPAARELLTVPFVCLWCRWDHAAGQQPPLCCRHHSWPQEAVCLPLRWVFSPAAVKPPSSAGQTLLYFLWSVVRNQQMEPTALCDGKGRLESIWNACCPLFPRQCVYATATVTVCVCVCLCEWVCF